MAAQSAGLGCRRRLGRRPISLSTPTARRCTPGRPPSKASSGTGEACPIHPESERDIFGVTRTLECSISEGQRVGPHTHGCQEDRPNVPFAPPSDSATDPTSPSRELESAGRVSFHGLTVGPTAAGHLGPAARGRPDFTDSRLHGLRDCNNTQFRGCKSGQGIQARIN